MPAFLRRVSFDSFYHPYEDEGFRHEIKYILSTCEHLKFRDLCAGFMDCDKNAGMDGEYTVKSYYFDTLYFDDYTEKQNGIYERKKYRLRTYDNSGYYRLEKKIKKGLLNKKFSGEICAADANMLLNGYTDIKTGNKNTDAIISEIYLKGYRRSVYIEYVRQAFTISELDLRITFDKGLSALYGCDNLQDTAPNPIPGFYDGESILEIKYKDSLPEWLTRAICWRVPSELSVSKYERSLKYILE